MSNKWVLLLLCCSLLSEAAVRSQPAGKSAHEDIVRQEIGRLKDRLSALKSISVCTSCNMPRPRLQVMNSSRRTSGVWLQVLKARRSQVGIKVKDAVSDRQGQTARIFYGAPQNLHQQAETLLHTLMK